MSIWMKNTDGKPSASLTMMFVGFVVVTLWLLVSIFSKIGHLEIREFDAGSAMSYFLPLASLYFGRRYSDGKFSMEKDKPQVTS